MNPLKNESVLVVKNKEGRADKIYSKILAIKEKGNMALSETQELHGLLNFPTGYFAERSLKYACFKIFFPWYGKAGTHPSNWMNGARMCCHSPGVFRFGLTPKRF